MLKTLFLLVVFNVCSIGYASTIQLSLQHLFGDAPVVLVEKEYVSAQGEKISFTRLKYYLGNVEFTFKDGRAYAEGVNYHLIDLEDPESLLIQFKNVPEGQLKAITFSIGVDSISNSNGLMDGDLDPLKGMYWAWSSGFINFKLEGTRTSEKTTAEFVYHIGGFIAPNESFQVKSIALDKKLEKDLLTIEMNVELKTLFMENKSGGLAKIMSPSLKAKKFSTQLPSIFSIKK
jgi:hypothetical protein